MPFARRTFSLASDKFRIPTTAQPFSFSQKYEPGGFQYRKLSDWWIDRAGRLSIVSLDSVIHNNPPAACLEQIQSENAANYRELIQAISLLALPRNHRLRKKFCKQKSTSKNGCLLAREDLPPLRSLNFCESIASGKYTPSLQTLETQLVQVNRGAHSVASRTRFFNSILSVAFSVPLLSASSLCCFCHPSFTLSM